MRKKIIGLVLSALLFALSFPSEAQQPKKVPRIGLLVPGTPSSYSSQVDAFQLLKDEFDAVYKESARHPMRMAYCVHPYVSGTPGRAAALEKFIRYVKRHPKVWFARCIDVANCVLGK